MEERLPNKHKALDSQSSASGVGEEGEKGPGTRIPGCTLTCRVVDWGPSWVERILRSRSTRWVHETRLWRYRTSFGVRRVLVYWLHWDACHWNLLA